MRLLYITPHLSTGGLPQFLLKKIEQLIDIHDLYLIEWDNVADAYVVQKNKLKELLKEKLITLNEDKNTILSIINKIKPDVIHFEEFPETFIDKNLLKLIYSVPHYKIVETTHGTGFRLEDKYFVPDKTMFVSGYNMEQYVKILKEFDVIDYPIYTKEKDKYKKSLGFNKNYFNIINVGLFTPGKNQGEVFEYARLLQNENVFFHFIGNLAENFRFYWGPITNNLPKNCKIWNEKHNVEDFYLAADLFLFTSKLENKPIVINEAINYNLPVLMYNLENYGDTYKNYKDVEFLTNNLDKNLETIKGYISNYTHEYSSILTFEDISDTIENINISNYNIKSCHLLTDLFSKREKQSIRNLSKLKDFGVKYEMYVNEPYKNLPPKETCAFPDIVSMEPGGKLTPAHYGCYLAHKNALLNSIEENNNDFILIFECDCGIKVSLSEFVGKVKLACDILNQNKELIMFSFVHHHDESILEKKKDYFIISEFIGAHSYLIPKRSYGLFKDLYNNTPWNVTDLFFANNLKKYKTGVFDEILTFQYPGYSLLEKIENVNEKI